MWFDNIPEAPPNNILGLASSCKADTSPEKIDIIIGAYRDDSGAPVVLPSIREAETRVFNNAMNHEYLPQDGLAEFNSSSQILMFSESSDVIKEKRVHTMQGLSGTGCIRLALEFLKKYFPETKVYLPSVTWGNHAALVKSAGLVAETYSYLDEAGTGLNFQAMLADLKEIPDGNVVLMHACAHNPSGVDPTEEEWQQVLDVFKSKNILAFFDNAYQGFVSGDPNVDAYAVRLMADAGLEMICACSFSKNMGLYGERVGALHFVVSSEAKKNAIATQLRVISRVMYSTAPSFGPRIVSTILTDPALKTQWIGECALMAKRLTDVRQQLYEGLKSANVKGTWEHVIKQRGMFSYTGLDADTVEKLKSEYHIYMLKDGRISLAGLNSNNLDRFVAALKAILGTN